MDTWRRFTHVVLVVKGTLTFFASVMKELFAKLLRGLDTLLNPEVIWERKLDDHFTCRVVRESQYLGTLTIEEAGYTIHQKSVPLVFGAKFGPECEDVYLWQQECTKVVDGLVKAKLSGRWVE